MQQQHEELVWVDFDILERFMFDVFRALGVPEDDAKICSDVLITADRRGITSHGINRLKQIYYDRLRIGIQQPVTNFVIIRQTPATAVVDGHDGMGFVIAKRAMELAMNKAKELGIGMVAVKNSTHYGIAGYYVMMAAEAGLIGITGTNTRPGVAPTFGVENMLGTNPLTIGLPTDEEFPFVIDCATSIAQRGKIEVYAKEGKVLPEGWVIGQDGDTRTDPEQILNDFIEGTAALAPLGGIGEDTGGHKGYGYSTVVEILSAALQGGNYLKMLSGYEDGKRVPYHLGHFFIAIDVSAFIELDEFKRTAGDILRTLRASKKMPGQNSIYTAGEKEHLAWLANKDKGVPLNNELQKEIKVMLDELGLEQKEYKFPFL